jgi:hypothetical protein
MLTQKGGLKSRSLLDRKRTKGSPQKKSTTDEKERSLLFATTPEGP